MRARTERVASGCDSGDLRLLPDGVIGPALENTEPAGTPGGDDGAHRSDADDGTCEPGRVERQEALHGFTIRTPMSAKSSTFPVATVAP